MSDHNDNMGHGSKFRRIWGRFSGESVDWAGKAVKAFVVLGLAALIFYVLGANDGFYRENELKNRKIALEAENLQLEEENRQLTSRLERFGQDPEFMEDEARRKLRLVRPGEVIYRLAEEPDLSDNEATERLR
ncbi:MAG: septum formation initiator family protein [Deltaproteobacteria bacterium]|jgi:cell division protein FtsB|nr:septum formation initiator family protein [Deltaproteobacteria bacterium]